jgi:magnesium chelatase subunit D
VEADDLQVAVRLVIAPRALQLPPPDPDQPMEPPPPRGFRLRTNRAL